MNKTSSTTPEPTPFASYRNKMQQLASLHPEVHAREMDRIYGQLLVPSDDPGRDLTDQEYKFGLRTLQAHNPEMYERVMAPSRERNAPLWKTLQLQDLTSQDDYPPK